MARICIVGAGYVGLVTGTCLADLGNEVVCLDVDEARISGLRMGVVPIFEPGLEELIQRNSQAGRLQFTTSYDEGVGPAEFVFIAVGTPSGVDGEADMQHVRAAAEGIARSMREPLVVVNKSTVPIGAGDWVARIVERNQPSPIPFWVVSNPEFLREGSAIHDFLYPDRVVLGSTDRQAAQRVAELYQPLRCPMLVTDLRTAEMIKYASNSFLATKISFINEIASICEQLGADVKVVARGMGLDKRIGSSFLEAGLGWGGSCFSADESTFVLNSEEVAVKPFAELFASFPDRTAAGSIEIVVPEGKRVLAYDLDSRQPVLAEVRCLTRRWYEGDFVTIRTRMGRSLRVTADHPVVLYQPESDTFQTVLARDVREGDSLAAAVSLPRLVEPIAVNLIEKLRGSRLEPIVRVRFADSYFPRVYRSIVSAIPTGMMKSKYDVGRNNCMPLAVYGHLKDRALIAPDESQLRMFTAGGGPVTDCPAVFSVDEDLLRFLGYYAAEGWITRDTGRYGAVRERIGIAFGAHGAEYIEDLQRILGRWGIKHATKLRTSVHTTLVSSRPLAFLLREVLGCGVRSDDKRVPKLVLNLSEPLKLAFLQGLLSGDGAITPLNQGRHLIFEYATVSKPLADGVALLLQSLGVVPSVRTRWMNKSKQPAYIVRINGLGQLAYLKRVFGLARQQEIEERIAGYERNIAQFGFRRHDGHVSLRVVSVEFHSGAEHVYSMETSTGTLIAASGLLCHNCFPKDIKALEYMAATHGCHPQMLRAVMDINRDQRRRLVQKVRDALGGSLFDRTIAVLGLAFKPNTDDMRDAPAITIVQQLQREGARVRAYDPAAMKVARSHLPDVELCSDAYDAARDADALVICTDWNEFKQLDLERLRGLLARPIIVDGRNIYPPDRMAKLGFAYHGVGRPLDGCTEDEDERGRGAAAAEGASAQ